MRPSLADMVHRVDLYPLGETGGSDGAVLGAVNAARPAIVDEKQRMVVDQREGADGSEIRSSGIVFAYLEDYVRPGSDVVIRKGTPAERRVSVIAVSYFDHPDAPEHVELFIE